MTSCNDNHLAERVLPPDFTPPPRPKRADREPPAGGHLCGAAVAVLALVGMLGSAVAGLVIGFAWAVAW